MRVPRIWRCCSAISATFGLPSTSTECLDAQLQTEVLKSQHHCAKPVQAATILQLKGSKEAVSGAAASPAQIAEKTLLTFSHSTRALVKGTHKRCLVLWGKGSPKAWPLQPDTQLGDGASRSHFPKGYLMCWKALFFTTEPEIKAQDRDAPAQPSPPGCSRSCQEASEQLGIEASGTSQRVPAHGEGSPGTGQPQSHHHISVPEKSPSQAKRNPNPASK